MLNRGTSSKVLQIKLWDWQISSFFLILGKEIDKLMFDSFANPFPNNNKERQCSRSRTQKCHYDAQGQMSAIRKFATWNGVRNVDCCLALLGDFAMD